MIKILGLGDNTIDTYVFQDTGYPGGNAVNVAVFCQRLGAQAAYLGFLGDDERGRVIRDALLLEGVEVSQAHMVKGVGTNYALVELKDKDRVFTESESGACELIHLEAEDFEYIAGFDLVHSSVYSHLESQLPQIRQHSKKLSFDFSDRHDLERLQKVGPYIDYAFLSCSEISMEEQGKRMDQLLELGASLVVATRGKAGSWAKTERNSWHQGSLPANVVDTLGAGDAFIAALLMNYSADGDLAKAMYAGAAYAARACEHYGGWGHGVPISQMGKLRLLERRKS